MTPSPRTRLPADTLPDQPPARPASGTHPRSVREPEPLLTEDSTLKRIDEMLYADTVEDELIDEE